MLESIKKILESILSKGIYDIIKGLFLIVLGGCSGILVHFYTVNNKYLMPYAIILAITSVAAVTSLAFIIYTKFSILHNFYLKNDFDYVFLEKKLIYEYTSPERITYTKKYKIKLRKSTDRFLDKFNWTGSCAPTITCFDKNLKKLELILTTRRDSFQQFEVHFGKIFKKGEIIDLVLIFVLTDKDHKAASSLSTTVVDPTKKLTLEIRIDKEYRTNYAIYEMFPTTDSRLTLETKKYEFPDNNSIEIEIDNPKMLLVYSFSWENPKSLKDK